MLAVNRFEYSYRLSWITCLPVWLAI